jgi:transcriptional regulator with XRE-family HTH domain
VVYGPPARIGLRLREARKAQGLSLTGLSARTGAPLSKSKTSNYEQGTRRRGIEEAKGLADAPEAVSTVYLLCLDGEGFLTEGEMALFRCFGATDRGPRRGR